MNIITTKSLFKLKPTDTLTISSNKNITKIDETMLILENEYRLLEQQDFEDGITFREAVELAGGYRDSADKRGAYIIKENGLIYKPGTNIFISSQDVYAGDTIVIPTKILAQNSTMDIAGILGDNLQTVTLDAVVIPDVTITGDSITSVSLDSSTNRLITGV